MTRYARKSSPPPTAKPYDPDLERDNAVMVPINWLKYALERLAEQNEDGPTLQKLRQRAAEWLKFRAPGYRPVRLDEQRAEFETAFPLPEGVFWSVSEREYQSVGDLHKEHQQARIANLLYKGWLKRAETPEGM